MARWGNERLAALLHSEPEQIPVNKTWHPIRRVTIRKWRGFMTHEWNLTWSIPRLRTARLEIKLHWYDKEENK